ncbi:hypothetical protein ACIBCM_09760 [Streptomyces sp. NPDC051018]|uniref:hypothetical protein n=1 Tax=Streptomyces sp. NPDC051018 TaxID=3365639 RepID=UPI0037B02265
MGSSYMEYRGCGFWSRDFQAEVWLYLLSREAAQAAGRPAWLDAARGDWEIQATTGFMGCVSPCLDEHLGAHPDRVATVAALSELVRQRLTGWDPAIPKDVVNAFGTGGEPESFNDDLDTRPLLAFADMFIGLLRGEIPAEPGTTSAF